MVILRAFVLLLALLLSLFSVSNFVQVHKGAKSNTPFLGELLTSLSWAVFYFLQQIS